MKNETNKGFTLIELLSVIALLAVLAVIVIPNIDKLLRDSRTNLYSKQISLIEVGAKLWATDEENAILLKNNEIWPLAITLSDLQMNGFIDKDIIDPRTEEKFPDSLLIYIDKIDDKYSYYIDEYSNDPLAPIITLNGNSVIELEIQSDYNEQNAIATKPDGTTISVTNTIKKNGSVSSINKSVVSTYTITYTASYVDSRDVTHTGTIVRVVQYVDTTSPIITCNNCEGGTITIESADNYDLPLVTVTDNSNENINAVVTGSFSSKIPGNKSVTYQATDSSGNTGTLEITFIVEDTIKPQFSYTTNIENSIIKYEIIATDSGSGIKEYSFDGGSTWQKSNLGQIPCGDFTYLVVRDYANNESSEKVSTVCNVTEWNYAYNGTSQSFTALYAGWYQIELWGAQGGDANTSYIGGKGAYTFGKIYLDKDETIYVYVGGEGEECQGHDVFCNGGYNGGGNANNNWSSATTDTKYKAGGGGATDVRYGGTSFNDRIMVAAGGGGGAYFYHGSTSYLYCNGGHGGTLMGLRFYNCQVYSGIASYLTKFSEARQNAPGESSWNNSASGFSSFGTGFSTYSGGGGGYYGGIASVGYTSGGSSFISGYAGANAITSSVSLVHTNNTMHYSHKYFIDGRMESGVNTGNGRAKITYISEIKPQRINSNLNGVQYIEDCTTGSGVEGRGYWAELQAIKDGVNIAKGLIVTPTVSAYSSSSNYGNITDGNISNFGATSTNVQGSRECVTMDLVQPYDLDEIAVWHLHDQWSTSYQPIKGHTMKVSSDNTNWITIISNGDISESSNGKRVSAYAINIDSKNIPIKYQYGATWARVFYHNNKNGTVLFASDAEALNTYSPDKQSILYALERFKGDDGKYEFLLQYPEVSTTLYNRWKQSEMPQNDIIAGGDGSANATGYEAINISWSENYWGGLAKAISNTSTYIDGSVGHGNWFYAIGSKGTYLNGIPGPSSMSIVSTVELWVRIDDYLNQ